jgi:23S rRNA pseudouridine1911/1915/1917 synthase
MFNIETLFEDKDILVINKPTGLVVNNSETTEEETLQDIVKDKIDRESALSQDSEFLLRSGIVHRLDKDTSGVLIIAKNEKAFQLLQSQFKERNVEKEYIAIVFGDIKEPLIEINAPIGRDLNNRLRYAVVKDGRESTTVIRRTKGILLHEQDLTVVKCMPKTGRTHQIRVHLAALGHPVVGDVLYSSRVQLEYSKNYFHRLMLHAEKISFTHPTTNEVLTINASVPSEFSIA